MVNISKKQKGITIQIEGETTGLDKALKSSKDKSIELTKELKEINKALKFDPNNVKLLSQQKEVLEGNAKVLNDKLYRLKQVQEQVEKQNQLGTIDPDQYRAFNLELEKTQNELSSVVTQMEKTQTKLDGVTSGSTQKFNEEFNNITQSIEESTKQVDKYGLELQGLDAKYASNSKSVEALSAKKEVLGNMYEANKAKTEAITKAMDLMASTTGTSSKEYQKLEQDLNKSTSEMYRTEKAINATTNELSNMETGVDDLGNAMDSTSNKTSVFGDVLKANLATELIVGGLKATTSAITGVASATTDYVMQGMENVNAMVEQEAKLQLVMRNTMDATDEQIQKIHELAQAQEEKGVVSAKAQIAGSQELATYLEKSESLETLIPIMNDMVAQQYGYNASAESTVSVATMLGKVMDGQVGALSRYGYSFTEVQEQILKYGTEAERAAVLTEVVGQSVGGMNEALGQTPDGQLIQLNNTLSQTQFMIGEVANELRGQLIEAVLPGLNDVVGQSLDIVGDFSTAMQEAGGDIGIMGEAIGEFITDLLELVAEQLPQIIDIALDIVTMLVDTILEQLPMLIDVSLELITTILDTLIQALPQVASAGIEIILALALGLQTASSELTPVALEALFTIVNTILDNLDAIIDTAIQIIELMVDTILDCLPLIIEAVPEIIIAIVETIVRNLPKIIDAGINIVVALVNGIISSIPALVSATLELMRHFFENIENLFRDIKSLGANIVKSLINGIRSMFSNLRRVIRDMFRITRGDEGVANEAMEVMNQIGKDIVEAQIEIIEEMTEVIKEEQSTFEKMGEDLQGSLASGINKGSGNVANATRNSAQRSNNEARKGQDEALRDQERAEQEQLRQQEEFQREQLKQQEQALREQEEVIKRHGDATVVALKESYSRQFEDKKSHLNDQLDIVKNSQFDEVEIIRNGSHDKMNILSREHIDRISQIDEITALQLRGINQAIDAEIQRISIVDAGLANEIQTRRDRINEIEAESEAERRELQRRREQERLNNLQQRLDQAENEEERRKAEKELSEYRQELARNRREEERREERNKLNDEIRDLEDKRREENRLFEESIKEQEVLQQYTLNNLSNNLKEQEQYWKSHFDELANHANKTVASMFKSGDTEQIKYLLQTYNSDWEEAGKTFMDYFKNGLESDPIDLSLLLQNSNKAVENIKELDEVLSVDNEALKTNYTNTNTILEEYISNTIDLIDNMIEEVTDMLTRSIPTMKSLGRDMMESFYNGMVDVEPKIISKAESIAQNVIDIISSALNTAGGYSASGFSYSSDSAGVNTFSGLDLQVPTARNLELQLEYLSPKVDEKATQVNQHRNNENHTPRTEIAPTQEGDIHVYLNIDNFNNSSKDDIRSLGEQLAFQIKLEKDGRGKGR